jgi:hypothetical protein
MKQLDVTALLQFWTIWNYQETNWKDLYYRNRTVDESNPVRLDFYRLALAVTYKL